MVWRKEDRDKFREEHPGYYTEAAREYRRQHLEETREYQRKYNAEHKEQYSEYRKRFQRKRKEAIATIDAAFGVEKQKTPEQIKRHEYYLKHKAEYLARAKKQQDEMTTEKKAERSNKRNERQKMITKRLQEARELGIIE